MCFTDYKLAFTDIAEKTVRAVDQQMLVLDSAKKKTIICFAVQWVAYDEKQPKAIRGKSENEIVNYWVSKRIRIIEDTVSKLYGGSRLNIFISLKLLVKDRNKIGNKKALYDWDIYKDIFQLNPRLDDSCATLANASLKQIVSS